MYFLAYVSYPTLCPHSLTSATPPDPRRTSASVPYLLRENTERKPGSTLCRSLRFDSFDVDRECWINAIPHCRVTDTTMIPDDVFRLLARRYFELAEEDI